MSALTDLFTSIANAIRTKKGTSGTITASNFPTEIVSIPSTDYYFVSELPNQASYLQRYYFKHLPALSLPSTITGLSNTFGGCGNLEELDLSLWDTSNITSMQGTFNNCSSLQKIILSSNFDCGKVKTFSTVFGMCISLEQITGGCFKDLGKGFAATGNINFALNATKLDHDSLVRIINGLYDVTSRTGNTTLTLGSTLQAKLSSTEIAVATTKGWTVA